MPLPGLDGQRARRPADRAARGANWRSWKNSLLTTGIIVAAAGILLGLGLSWWATARVTRPVRRLAESAGRVAAGDWNHGGDLVHRRNRPAGRGFNRMTRELIAQRERLIQAERVAAWRELARRLAHELKNPLFPLQITVENMLRARDSYPDSSMRCSAKAPPHCSPNWPQLKQIIGRFSDFAKMPAPEVQPVNLNELAAETLKLFEPQLAKAHDRRQAGVRSRRAARCRPTRNRSRACCAT